ncbi:MAG TPA: hypothetical protein VK465_13425 [Fibrobacteria bacterium]|nr:hypothetical protein [Fibrobacteria bacterium]
MSGKIGPHQPKVTHGPTSTNHLKSTKPSEGKQRNDHEAGPSEKAPNKDEANAQAHKPGQDAPLSLSAESYTPSSGKPASSSSGKPSNNSGKIQREEGAESNRSSNSSNGFDEVLSLMAGGKFKTWNEFQKTQTFSKAERFDIALDKNGFVSRHLNPDIQSPEHVKTNWTKLPGFGEPMHAEYTIAQNPSYYTFRRPAQHSGPLSLPSQSGAKADYQSDPRSTQSSPSSSFRKDLSADSTVSNTESVPEGSGSAVNPESTTAPKENNSKSISTREKLKLGGVAGLVAATIIAVGVGTHESESSSDSGDASA